MNKDYVWGGHVVEKEENLTIAPKPHSTGVSTSTEPSLATLVNVSSREERRVAHTKTRTETRNRPFPFPVLGFWYK